MDYGFLIYATVIAAAAAAVVVVLGVRFLFKRSRARTQDNNSSVQ
ncbi:hypothetical protein [Ruania zhangjianzhongii]|nr:hypothetical protein [Ruania zhangjianzhongii]